MQVVTVQLLQNLHLMCLAAGSGGNVVKPQMHLSGHFAHIIIFITLNFFPSGNFYTFYILHTNTIHCCLSLEYGILLPLTVPKYLCQKLFQPDFLNA